MGDQPNVNDRTRQRSYYDPTAGPANDNSDDDEVGQMFRDEMAYRGSTSALLTGLTDILQSSLSYGLSRSGTQSLFDPQPYSQHTVRHNDERKNAERSYRLQEAAVHAERLRRHGRHYSGIRVERPRRHERPYSGIDVEQPRRHEQREKHIPVPEAKHDTEAKPIIPICIVCQSNNINTVIVPCMHSCLCSSCANGILVKPICPICRTDILEINRIYMCGKEMDIADVRAFAELHGYEMVKLEDQTEQLEPEQLMKQHEQLETNNKPIKKISKHKKAVSTKPYDDMTEEERAHAYMICVNKLYELD